MHTVLIASLIPCGFRRFKLCVQTCVYSGKFAVVLVEDSTRIELCCGGSVAVHHRNILHEFCRGGGGAGGGMVVLRSLHYIGGGGGESSTQFRTKISFDYTKLSKL